MSRLISDSEFAEIRGVLNDVQDTFYGVLVSYKRDVNTITRWQKDVEETRKYESIELNALVVWSTSDADAELVRSVLGADDRNVGYCNVKYDQCLELGIINADKNIIATPAEDQIEINKKVYPVLGLIKLGQLWDTEVVVKILFRKDSRKSNE